MSRLWIKDQRWMGMGAVALVVLGVILGVLYGVGWMLITAVGVVLGLIWGVRLRSRKEKAGVRKRHEFEHLKTPAGDISRLILDSSGVYVVLERPDRGKISVRKGSLLLNGKPVTPDPLEQLEERFSWIRSRIQVATGNDIPVYPVLYFPHAYVRVRHPVRRVRVVGRKLYPRAVRGRAGRIHPSQLKRLVQLFESLVA